MKTRKRERVASLFVGGRARGSPGFESTRRGPRSHAEPRCARALRERARDRNCRFVLPGDTGLV